MSKPIIVRELLNKFADEQICSECPIQSYCDAAMDKYDSPSICSIIKGDFDGAEDVNDESKD